jgi:hypothetical protein
LNEFSRYGNVLVLDANGFLRDAQTAKQRAMAEIMDLPIAEGVPFNRAYVATVDPTMVTYFDFVSKDVHLLREFTLGMRAIPYARESLLELQAADIPMALCTDRSPHELGNLLWSLDEIGVLRGCRNRRFFSQYAATNKGDKGVACQELGAWAIGDNSEEKISHIPIRKFVLGSGSARDIEYFPSWFSAGRLVFAERIIELYKQDFPKR